MPKIHLAVFRQNDYGGHNYATLCGRESGELDERNAEAAENKVTCKLCVKIMADPAHWRHRKWLTPNAQVNPAGAASPVSAANEGST